MARRGKPKATASSRPVDPQLTPDATATTMQLPALPSELLRLILAYLHPHTHMQTLRRASRSMHAFIAAAMADVAFAKTNLVVMCGCDPNEIPRHEALMTLQWQLLGPAYPAAIMSMCNLTFPVLMLLHREFVSLEVSAPLPRPHPDPITTLIRAMNTVTGLRSMDPTAENHLALFIAVAVHDDNDDTLFLSLLAQTSHPPLSRLLNLACRHGRLNIVTRLLEMGAAASTDGNYAVRKAAECGHTTILSLLLNLNDPQIDPSADHNAALRLACQNSHPMVVRILLRNGMVDPTNFGDVCIRIAANNGCADVVAALLCDGRADPAADDNFAIRCAARWGYLDIARMLVESGRCDVTAEDDAALKAAAEFGNIGIVRFLVEDLNRADVSTPEGRRVRDAAIKSAMINGHVDAVRCLLRMPRILQPIDQPADESKSLVAKKVSVVTSYSNGTTKTTTMDLMTGELTFCEQPDCKEP